MSAITTKQNGNGSSKAAVSAGHLAVVVGCHGIIVALPVERVLRLVLPDQLEMIEEARRIANVDGHRFAVRDLGELLGLSPLSDATVLLQIPHDGQTLSIALMTGPCVVVDHVRPEMSFPAAAFRARASAFLGAFNVKSIVGGNKTSAAYGVLIDPARLFDREELSRVASDLSAHGGGGEDA